MPAKPDPIADALNAAVATHNRAVGAIERYFDDRPAVKDSIIAASIRGVPKTEIAKLLTKGAPEGVRISDTMVGTWLDKHLPKTL